MDYYVVLCETAHGKRYWRGTCSPESVSDRSVVIGPVEIADLATLPAETEYSMLYDTAYHLTDDGWDYDSEAEETTKMANLPIREYQEVRDTILASIVSGEFEGKYDNYLNTPPIAEGWKHISSPTPDDDGSDAYSLIAEVLAGNNIYEFKYGGSPLTLVYVPGEFGGWTVRNEKGEQLMRCVLRPLIPADEVERHGQSY